MIAKSQMGYLSLEGFPAHGLIKRFFQVYLCVRNDLTCFWHEMLGLVLHASGTSGYIQVYSKFVEFIFHLQFPTSSNEPLRGSLASFIREIFGL